MTHLAMQAEILKQTEVHPSKHNKEFKSAVQDDSAPFMYLKSGRKNYSSVTNGQAVRRTLPCSGSPSKVPKALQRHLWSAQAAANAVFLAILMLVSHQAQTKLLKQHQIL